MGGAFPVISTHLCRLLASLSLTIKAHTRPLMKLMNSALVTLFATSFFVVCSQAKGKPAKEVSQEVKEYYSLVNPGPCPTHGAHSRMPYYFVLDCKKCVCYKQLATVTKDHVRALRCRVHCDSGRQPSQLAMDARMLLCHGVPDMGPLVMEAHVLSTLPHKPFDFWLPQYEIAVEVDGEQHFDGSMHDTEAVVQYEYDRCVDIKIMQQGRRLVRLHYLDSSSWVGLLKEAIEAVKANRASCFVKLTPSYAKAANVYIAGNMRHTL